MVEKCTLSQILSRHINFGHDLNALSRGYIRDFWASVVVVISRHAGKRGSESFYESADKLF